MSDDLNPYATSYISDAILPENSLEGILADRGTRFAAALIDNVILIPIVFPVAFGVGLMLSMLINNELLLETVSTLVGGLIGVASFLAINGYLLATNGQTIGKRILYIRVVNNDGSKVAFSDLVLKRYGPIWLLSLVPYIGVFCSFIDAALIFRESKKCLHDDIAGTKVIKVP